MNKNILDYLKTQRLGVLAVEMLDGSPHGATVHFANSEDPFIFFFETNREYKKSEALFGRDESRATFVVGVDENNLITFQLDGIVRLVKEEEMELYKDVYLEKFPNKAKKIGDPKVVHFIFTPTWWRYTDWTKKGESIVLTSDGK
jgi:hypothetical protein